ncbi:hypothetical protein KFE25_007326 [Diacronema lutheri]|uniref:Uncharacterized protein n=1 Tax=Diacronema lutheri TaxID=2081491 RepID=A0A8J5XP21_DIALT|nr:hypothetical protein KFE25_007326 [Diacronema lutheri]
MAASPRGDQLVAVLDVLQDVEAQLGGLLHRAAEALDAHDVARARPADPLDLIQYARELGPTTAARPGWDGRAHVQPQHYFAPTYEMILHPNSWLQIAARARPANPAAPASGLPHGAGRPPRAEGTPPGPHGGGGGGAPC